jgi:dTMP kinase
VSGHFITLEGVEGCGKSTQLERLGACLSAQGHDVLLTREPGGTAVAEAVRDVVLCSSHGAMSAEAELLLYAAARADHVHQIVIPALAAGRVVLCDRYLDSTLAYQGFARGLDAATIETIHHLTTGGLMPGRTYLFDLPEEEGLRRARERGRADRLEQESIAFHTRVRQGFLELARQAPSRITILDGALSMDELADQVARDAARFLAAEPMMEPMAGPPPPTVTE